MKEFNGSKTNLLLVGFVAAFLVGDGGNANAGFIFGEPTNLGPPVNSAYSERKPSISADGLELYFMDWPDPRPGGEGSTDIWVARRATTDDPWGEPVNLGPTVNSSSEDYNAEISADGLWLFFASDSDRPGGYGGNDPGHDRRRMGRTCESWAICQ